MQLLNVSAEKETRSVTRDPSLQALTSHFLELHGLNKLTLPHQPRFPHICFCIEVLPFSVLSRSTAEGWETNKSEFFTVLFQNLPLSFLSASFLKCFIFIQFLKVTFHLQL